jgi:cytochrome c oxidase subunit 3
MIAVMKHEKQKIHPHKFALWLALASIVMMFAGFTSAFIIKRSLANWVTFDLPGIFWYSTAVIIASSLTIMVSRNYFRQRQMQQYRLWLMLTLILGVAFVTLQYIGFTQLWRSGVTLTRSVSFSFLYILVGMHALHVIGGIVALAVRFIRAYSVKIKNYNLVPVDLMNIYWHFVDLLWLYLLVFLTMIR